MQNFVTVEEALERMEAIMNVEVVVLDETNTCGVEEAEERMAIIFRAAQMEEDNFSGVTAPDCY